MTEQLGKLGGMANVTAVDFVGCGGQRQELEGGGVAVVRFQRLAEVTWIRVGPTHPEDFSLGHTVDVTDARSIPARLPLPT